MGKNPVARAELKYADSVGQGCVVLQWCRIAYRIGSDDLCIINLACMPTVQKMLNWLTGSVQQAVHS